ncbi:MAG: type II toxin-antitoxin system VapC family toxin [Thermocrispum sp.]
MIFRESTAARLVEALRSAPHARIGAPTLVELSAVLTHRAGPKASSLLAAFLQRKNFDVLSFTEAHWRIAQKAYLRYGRGRHPAKLNLGDCFSYATAWVAGEPLLCVGDDFPQTDLDLVDLG